MNKNTLLISIVAIVLVGAGIYFNFYRQNSSSQKITNFAECVNAGNPVGDSYPAQCWTNDGRHFVEELDKAPTPPLGPITTNGIITCLPKVGTGAQTMECAFGLLADDGNYYGLKNLFDFDPEYKFTSEGMRVEVSGTLMQEEMIGPDGNNYAIVGTIELISIVEAGN